MASTGAVDVVVGAEVTATEETVRPAAAKSATAIEAAALVTAALALLLVATEKATATASLAPCVRRRPAGEAVVTEVMVTDAAEAPVLVATAARNAAASPLPKVAVVKPPSVTVAATYDVVPGCDCGDGLGVGEGVKLLGGGGCAAAAAAHAPPVEPAPVEVKPSSPNEPVAAMPAMEKPLARYTFADVMPVHGCTCA